MMNGLSETTWQIVRKMVSSEQQGEARRLLVEECGANLPFCEKYDELQLERVRFAVLKLSGGKLDDLREAIQDAQTDWRDILMWAGFGNDVSEHEQWASSYLGEN